MSIIDENSRGGTLSILGHGVKGQGHIWYFVFVM